MEMEQWRELGRADYWIGNPVYEVLVVLLAVLMERSINHRENGTSPRGIPFMLHGVLHPPVIHSRMGCPPNGFLPTMDTNASFTRSFDESLIRELPQLQTLRIAPLRQPVSRLRSIPSPLEPNASRVRESPSNPNNASILPARNDSAPSGAPEGVTSRPKKTDPSVDSLLSLDPPPPRPILPAFVNLRALERFSYSFDDDSLHFRKRRRLGVQTETFGEHLQLPIPQAQKEQRPPPFGPFAILNGLNEPPPNAALLPPIEPGSITQLLTKPSRASAVVEPALLSANAVADSQIAERREGRIEEILDSPVDRTADGGIASGLLDEVTVVEPTRFDKTDTETDPRDAPTEANVEPLSPKTRGRSRKNLRKWTEEETTALLRGVVKCGIGNWTAILAQPELKFNKRSASNLKDRFRVCCPWAYRAADPNEATKQLHDTLANALSRAETEGSDGQAGKIHLPHPRPAESHASGSAVTLNESSGPKEADPKGTKTTKNSSLSKTAATLSSRSKSTLASLGIPEPHFTMKSRRRSRRPFTVVEDEALLKGYAVHGFQWTLIQQDKRLNLSHRRATDLRDRFRTKFPHAYRDGGSVSGRTLHGKPLKESKEHVPGNELEPYTRPKPDVNARRPIDPALAPPAPPQGLHESSSSAGPGGFPFPLDENGSGEASWADNTLAPMMWDELA
ncbi:hypothetical protein ASPCADRAFT_504258 [Aspergillus carbonarius ITEM 5010]|uniref:Myb-like domain-containing protein n=1 Tax=Aspergillus carbonarius (strain ITEM 5010) TaxID=602072 RepID=A0A1R3RVY1_ASPC5|nr:hypothetical protein ASPCADRAFT_504258 [Aspergillus carbonarius ITEM 5010]